jgi:hypothetical protein
MIAVFSTATLLIIPKLFRHILLNPNGYFSKKAFTTRFARDTETAEGALSFPLPGDGGKGKIPVNS